MSHTINVTDLANQGTLLRVLLEMQNHGTSFSLVQNGVEVAKVVPVEKSRDKVSDEITKKRFETLEKIEVFSRKVAELWSTDENAAEAIANDRR